MQGQLQHAVGLVVACLTVRLDRAEGTQSGATRTNNELSDAVCIVVLALWILWREALIVMIMPIEHDIDARVI